MLSKFWNFLTPQSPDQPVLPDQGSATRWLIFWFFWSVCISAIYWILGPYSYMRIQDNADFNLPYRIAAARDLLAYGITYWQPKFSGGMPSLLHPMIDNFLSDGVPYLWFPAWAVYGFVMWLQRFLAGYFTFRLCQEVLKFNPVASLFAGLAYSLYLWSVQDFKLVDAFGLPAVALVFLLFDRLLHLPKLPAILLAWLMGVILAMVSQSVIHTFFLLAGLPFWFLIVRQSLWQLLLPRYIGFALGIILAEAPLFIALLTYTPVTTRGQTGISIPEPIPSMDALIHHIWEVIGWSELPQNGLYIALFVLGMVMANSKPKTLAWRLLALFLLSGIGSEFGYWLQCLFQETIPASRGNARDFNQFTIFLGPLLGGIGLHLLHDNSFLTNQRRRTLVALLTLFALTMPLVNWKETTRKLLHRLATDNYAINFNNPVLRDLAQRHKNDPTPFRVASVGTWAPGIAGASGDRIYPTYPHAYGLETVDGYYRLHSARYHRFWRRVIANSLAAYPEQSIRTMKWYYLFLPPQDRFANRTPLILNDWFNMDLLSLANTRFLISHWPLKHPALTLRHDPAQELTKGKEWEALRLREKIWRTIQGQIPDHALYLYENTAMLPRAFMTDQLRFFKDADSLLDAMASTPAGTLGRTALLEQPDVNITQLKFTKSRVNFDEYRPDHIKLTTSSDGTGLLVITNNFDPYWKVKINGQKGTIIPVYHAFQGVVVPSGSNQVVLDYWPPYRSYMEHDKN